MQRLEGVRLAFEVLAWAMADREGSAYFEVSLPIYLVLNPQPDELSATHRLLSPPTRLAGPVPLVKRIRGGSRLIRSGGRGSLLVFISSVNTRTTPDSTLRR